MQSSTKLLIVRHGQTDYNAEHKFDGQFNTSLTKMGKTQIQQLGRRLSETKIDVIVSSPLSRAVQTANAIIETQQVKPEFEIEQSFKEIDCGICTGLTRQEIQIRFPKLVEEWGKNTDPPFPNGESIKDVEERSIRAVINLTDKHKGKTILISGHGSLNNAIIGYYLQIPYGLRFKLRQSNCALSEIEYTSDKQFKVNYINN